MRISALGVTLFHDLHIVYCNTENLTISKLFTTDGRYPPTAGGWIKRVVIGWPSPLDWYRWVGHNPTHFWERTLAGEEIVCLKLAQHNQYAGDAAR